MSHAVMQRPEGAERSGLDRFEDPRQRALIEEDLYAAKTVCGVLIAIVTMGAILGIVSVIATFFI